MNQEPGEYEPSGAWSRKDSARTAPSIPSFRDWRWWAVVGPSVGVLIYALAVLWTVLYFGDVGISCVFGPKIKEVESSYHWSVTPDPPGLSARLRGPQPPPGRFSASGPVGRPDGELLTMLGGRPISNYNDYIRALRSIQTSWGQFVEVRWTTPEGPHFGFVRVQQPPWRRQFVSWLWFLQQMLIYVTGIWVFWRRPNDHSARLFYGLCVVTVISYVGGYHWTQIAKFPALIFPFAAFVVFVPIVSLHFYLIFPRPNPIFQRHRRPILTALYGVPALTAAGLWLFMIWSRWGQDGREVRATLKCLQYLALGYIGLAVGVFLLCLVCLIYSYYRPDFSWAERNQVRWILLATFLSIPPIAWLLWDATDDPARLGLSRSAWPMFIVSLLYTVAYARSIMRYKLTQAEEWFNRGKLYVAVSMGAGLLYSGGLVVGALFLGDRLKENQTSFGTVVACVTALALLSLSGAGRRWFQSALDRRFHREKYKFDQAMRQMSQAVGNLVDRPTLGRRLLDAAGEVLRVEWGALYLGDPAGGPLRLAACAGPEPDDHTLDPSNPLVVRLRGEPTTLRVPRAMSLVPSSDPATDAMIALGGELAAPLVADGALAGLLVLGPKRSGLPYEDEEVAFLDALGSVAVLALRSADIQQTLETLNGELREKVEKITEQQRRILILQDQLAGRRLADAGIECDGDASQGPGRNEPPIDRPEAFAAIRGSGPALRQMIAVARKVAASPSTVLIRGESGTGKELMAEAIHMASPRAGRPFVKVHCAALSQTLLESELFGHVRGAFTDAKTDRVGRFQQADGGTLFLDEIGDINLEVQTKLLRVLQEMQFERVGSSQTISVDVRILAATHQDLEALIRDGRFREDLYYRLNVFSLRMPSLRERREDIFELAVHFLNENARLVGKAVTQLDDAAIEALVAYDWPGNIRELENVLQRAVVLADGPIVTLDDLPPEVRRPGTARWRPRLAATNAARSSPLGSSWEDRGIARDVDPFPDDGQDAEATAFEHQRLLDALDESRGNKSLAARLLGMPRSTFFSKLKKHGLA